MEVTRGSFKVYGSLEEREDLKMKCVFSLWTVCQLPRPAARPAAARLALSLSPTRDLASAFRRPYTRVQVRFRFSQISNFRPNSVSETANAKENTFTCRST